MVGHGGRHGGAQARLAVKNIQRRGFTLRLQSFGGRTLLQRPRMRDLRLLILPGDRRVYLENSISVQRWLSGRKFAPELTRTQVRRSPRPAGVLLETANVALGGL